MTVLLAVVAMLAPSSEGPKPEHGCQTVRCHQRVVVRPYRPWLERLGACETRGMSRAEGYRAATGNGFYGRYQFTVRTWEGVGGDGMPHQAPPLEQDYRAVLLRRKIGNPHTTAGWPRCG